MNLKLHIKEINKIISKIPFKCRPKKYDVKKQHIFVETCFYEAVGSLSVMPSLLPHVLWQRSRVSLFLASMMSPVHVIFEWSLYGKI